MATNSQTKANRKNAKHSTGPTTPTGKAASSLNSLKHGLASSQLIIPGESEEEFNTFLTALLNEHQPATVTETLLVQDMAKHHWLADRAIRLQSVTIEQSFFNFERIAPALALLIRYQTANERAFAKSFATLNAMRKTAQSEIGSASKSAAQASAAEAATAQAEWHADLIRHMAPPMSIEEMVASGFILNKKTGNWEKTVGA